MNHRLRIPSLSLILLVTSLPLGAQTFTDVATSLGFPNTSDDTRGMAWADYDGDGDFDVYLQNQGGTSRLLRNDGTTFTNVTTAMAVSHASSGWSAAWGDYDNDGKPDLYLGNFQGNNCFHNNFPAAFTDLSTTNGTGDITFAQSVVWIDHDRDGDLDLYLTKELDPHRFFQNLGNGTFTDITTLTGLGDPQSHSYGVTWGDYDGDGDPDCFVSTCGAGTINRLFRNNLAGTNSLLYTEIGASAGVNYQPNTYGTEWVDLDDDGDLDLFVTGASGEVNHLYRNDGTLPMLDVAASAGVLGPITSGHGCDFGDYDNDGRIDIYVHNRGGASVLYRNLGGLTFAVVPSAAGAANTTGGGYDCSMIDFDNDGDLDIHVATGARDRIYRNSGNTNRWLQVVPIGTHDNRSGIGAKVEVTIGGQTQQRLIANGAGAFSQNLVPAHFGLGSATSVDLLRVLWPDGTIDTLTNVSSNQRLTVTQSSGLAGSVVLGSGCPNTLSQAPILTTLGSPTLGNLSFAIRVSNATPNVGSSLFFALAEATPAYDAGNGCLVHLDAQSLVTLFQSGLAPFASGTINPLGTWTVPIPLPSSHALAGFQIPFQAIVLDPNGPNGSSFVLTNGLRVRLGY